MTNSPSKFIAGSKDGKLCTNLGMVQINDLSDIKQSRTQFFQASLSGFLTTLEISSTGDIICLGFIKLI